MSVVVDIVVVVVRDSDRNDRERMGKREKKEYTFLIAKEHCVKLNNGCADRFQNFGMTYHAASYLHSISPLRTSGIRAGCSPLAPPCQSMVSFINSMKWAIISKSRDFLTWTVSCCVANDGLYTLPLPLAWIQHSYNTSHWTDCNGNTFDWFRSGQLPLQQMIAVQAELHNVEPSFTTEHDEYSCLHLRCKASNYQKRTFNLFQQRSFIHMNIFTVSACRNKRNMRKFLSL